MVVLMPRPDFMDLRGQCGVPACRPTVRHSQEATGASRVQALAINHGQLRLDLVGLSRCALPTVVHRRPGQSGGVVTLEGHDPLVDAYLFRELAGVL